MARYRRNFGLICCQARKMMEVSSYVAYYYPCDVCMGQLVIFFKGDTWGTLKRLQWNENL